MTTLTSPHQVDRSPTVTEYDGLAIECDRNESRLAADAVMGATFTTSQVVHATPDRPIATALDLGCGSGSLAMLAARRAESVVAVDVNPRACEFTTRNAHTNGLEHVEVRCGDLYDPVLGERFDLITANLPFVVSPDTHLAYRDGTMRGDEISRAALAGATHHLQPDGVAVMTVSWAVRGDTTPIEAARRWINDVDADVWMLTGITHSPSECADGWLNTSRPGRDAARSRERWLDFYRAAEIHTIAYGVVVVHRRHGDGPRWRRVDRATAASTRNGGRQVERALRLGPMIAAASDDEIERMRFDLVGPHRLDQQLDYDNGYQARAAVMTLSNTCGVTGVIDPLITEVVLRLDGHTPLRQVLDSVIDGDHDSRPNLAATAIATLRELTETGIVHPTNKEQSS